RRPRRRPASRHCRHQGEPRSSAETGDARGNRRVDCHAPAVKAVIDTNVVANFFLATGALAAECEEFIVHADDLIAPSTSEGELTSALWLAVRKGVITVDQAGYDLRNAQRLGIQAIAARRLWQGALLRSIESGLSPYDSLFVELAEREQAPLATFDAAMLKAF